MGADDFNEIGGREQIKSLFICTTECFIPAKMSIDSTVFLPKHAGACIILPKQRPRIVAHKTPARDASTQAAACVVLSLIDMFQCGANNMRWTGSEDLRGSVDRTLGGH
jgi:hypothetical protein